VSGYAGSGTAFEEAISEFAVAYGDQTEKDWSSFLAAIKDGRVVAAAPETRKS
jgi:PhoPQ-activated pathogenicity-related protein